MTDLSKTIAPKSDQLNADDLIGGPITLTVTRVSGNDNADQPVNIFFEGDNGKPYRPCKSMRRVMVQVWGNDGATYVGRAMTIYRDPEVAFGGMKVGGIRISHMTNIDAPITMALTATRANRKPFTVKPLKMQDRAPQVDPAAALSSAMAAANRGTEAFSAWWNSDEGKAMRGAVRPHMAKIKDAATTADNAMDSDPFGLPPADPTTPDRPTQEQLDAAMAEAERAAREGMHSE